MTIARREKDLKIKSRRGSAARHAKPKPKPKPSSPLLRRWSMVRACNDFEDRRRAAEGLSARIKIQGRFAGAVAVEDRSSADDEGAN